VRYAPEPYAPRAFPPVCGALIGIQIELRLACWKYLDVYFPTQVEFSNFVSICPSKSAFSGSISCWCKRWQKGDFHGVFEPFGHPKLDEMLWK